MPSFRDHFLTTAIRQQSARHALHCLIAASTVLTGAMAAKAQVSFTGSYSQDFNGMGSSGTIMPAGWSHHGELGGNNDTWSTSIPASGTNSAATAGTVNNSLIVSTGTSGSSSSRAYNLGSSGSSNRSLGTSPTSTSGNILQLRLTNNTGDAVSALSIGYAIRRFNSVSTANELPGYWVFVSTNNGSSWTELTVLRPSISTVPNSVGTSTFGPVVVTLPSPAAAGGEIRLRWVDDNADQTSPDQIIGLDDLVISTGSASSCPTPSGLTATSITTTSAVLSWSVVSGATAYNVQWRPNSSATFTTVSGITGTSTTLTGLASATEHLFRVQAVCGSTSGSYSAEASFTTGGATGSCATPGSLAAGSISTTSALLSWGAVSGATAYELQWKPTSSSTYTTVTGLTNTSYGLSGLTSATAYDFRVRAVCSGGVGAYSAVSSFTTSGGTLNEVIYIWSGAIQPTSATVVAKMTSASTTCRAVVSTSQTLSNPIYSAMGTANSGNNFMAKMNITGLAPNTTYFYAIESGGVVDNSSDDIGRFRTPGAGPYSFSFALGSCSNTGNHGVYTAIQNKNPLFFLETGDFHYQDPNSSNISAHRTPYESIILSQTPSRNLLKNVALAHMWDDHDYCGNNNSGPNQPGTASARQAYREYIPHYPIAAGSGNNPIYQAFTIGRVHFILADLRSARTSTSMFGPTQKAWFQQQCLFARDNCLMIAWVTGTQFAGDLADNWGGFSNERIEISNWFRDNNIRNLFIMSGDAHMIAIDNGSNHDFSTGSNNPNDYPVFAAAALNKGGSDKGGTYSQGKFPNPSSSTGQYGLVEVTDNGGPTISIAFKGYRTSGNSATDAIITSYSFSRTICPGSGMAPEPVLALRELEQGRAVQLAWDEHGTHDWLRLERADDAGGTRRLLENAPGRGDLRDDAPVAGWNHYRLLDQAGAVVAEKSIFVKSVAAVSMYPNPTNGHFTVDLGEIKGRIEGRYILYNDLRRSVLMGDISLEEERRSFTIDASELESGTYLVYLHLNGMTVAEKIVLVK